MEDYYLGKASERIFLPLIRKTVPEIVDMHFPAAGIFHNFVLISIDKRYPGHARKIMSAVSGDSASSCSPSASSSSTRTSTSRSVRPRSPGSSGRTWIRARHSDVTKGPVDDLDDAALMPAFGGKMGVDATRKWASEGVRATGRRGSRRPRPQPGEHSTIWDRLQKPSNAHRGGER